MEFVVFDTEFTSWEGCIDKGWHDWQKKEIVQIAAIKVDAGTLEVTGELNLYVKPKINPELSSYFIKLTGITNEKISKEGLEFREAYKKFKDFVGNLSCFSHGWSLSGSPLADGEVMSLNLEYNNMQDNHPPKYKNIAYWFKRTYKSRAIKIAKQSSGEIAQLLGREKEMERLSLKGHNALYDVYSILEGLKYLGFNFADEID